MALTAAIVGAGNLSTHLSSGLLGSSFIELSYIFSRKFKDAESLATKVNCTALRSLSEIPKSIDIIFIWVKDDQIGKVSGQLAKLNLKNTTLVVHSSGAKSLNIIDPYFKNVSVMWPIQSFSKSDAIQGLDQIPFCVLGSNKHSKNTVNKIAKSLSNNVISVDEEKKAKLHLAAVFANNFSNHLFHIVEKMLAEEDLSIDIMLPILRKTVEKIEDLSPASAQTGPAIREDHQTMQKQLDLLKTNKDVANIYKILSDHIIKLKDQ